VPKPQSLCWRWWLCSRALSPFALMVDGSGVASGAGFVDLHVSCRFGLLLSALLLITRSAGLVFADPGNWLRRSTLLPWWPRVVLRSPEFLVASAGPEPLGGTAESWWLNPLSEAQHSRHPQMLRLKSVQDLVLEPRSS